jgi:hypothetical protein
MSQNPKVFKGQHDASSGKKPPLALYDRSQSNTGTLKILYKNALRLCLYGSYKHK